MAEKVDRFFVGYVYDDDTLVLDKETISYASGLVRTLDRSQDNLLRPSGFQLLNGTTMEHGYTYGYDGAGRLDLVQSSVTAEEYFNYKYVANSGSLLESVTGPAHTVTNTYEATRNVLQQKRNTAGDLSQITNTPISNFVYTVNDLGQRDDVSRSGSAFTSANTETWKYNAKGEVVTANHSTNNGFDRSYEFDGIGNRKKSADSLTLPTSDNYQANALNQYGSIDGNTRSFDDDGNLVDDGSKIYTWDAENRLIAIHQREADGSKGAEVASYEYDFKSRRITKTVAGVETNFIYDGLNLIAAFAEKNLSKTYVWGKDMSGSLSGSGGVGGLLSVNDGSATYYPVYDGNGNVSEYVDVIGAVVAHYEYDTFGMEVASGAKKDDFIHLFSTKQRDTESGLLYYAYRYYSPNSGCWLGRDPIQEQGGLNIYSFTLNSPVWRWDVSGMISEGQVYRMLFDPMINALKGFAQSVDNAVDSAVGSIVAGFTEWNDKAKLKVSLSSDRRIKRDWMGFQAGIGYSVSANGCCVTVKGKGFAQLELKSPKAGIFNLVGRGSGTIDGTYKYCWYSDTVEWDGGFRFSASGGVQASLGTITRWGGAKVTGEVGAGISNYYSFGDKEWSGWDVSVYGRAYAEWKAGWYYERKEFRVSYGGNLDVY